MHNFTAIIEDSIFSYEVTVTISKTGGVEIIDIYFGGSPLSRWHTRHFVETYCENELEDEIMTQYCAELEAQKMDKAEESLNNDKLKGLLG